MGLSRGLNQKDLELIRADLRKEIELKISKQDAIGFWGFLNSGFGLWLMSAIFISGIGTLYTNHQNAEKERQQIAETSRLEQKKAIDRINRLSMEFSYRLSNALIKLEAASKAMKSDPSRDPYKLRIDALAALSNPSSEQMPPLFSEFKAYSGVALVAELSTIMDTGENKALKERIAALSGILNDASIVDISKPQGFQDLAGELLKGVKHHRWDNGFRFTDCTQSNPFC